jgi:hypothetical protein
LVTDDAGDRRRHLAAVEAFQPHRHDARVPAQLAQPRAEPVLAAELVGAVRADQQHPAGVQVPGQEAEQLGARGVAPVQVLEDEHDRAPLGQGRDAGEDRLEAPRLGQLVGHAAGRRIGAGPRRRPGRAETQPGRHRGEQVGQPGVAGLPQEVAKDADDRPVGQAAAVDRDAHAGRHQCAAGPGPTAELVDQAGLADAGVTGHQHRGGRSGGNPIERGDQDVQLLGPAHERGAGHPVWHGRSLARHPVRISAVAGHR